MEQHSISVLHKDTSSAAGILHQLDHVTASCTVVMYMDAISTNNDCPCADKVRCVASCHLKRYTYVDIWVLIMIQTTMGRGTIKDLT